MLPTRTMAALLLLAAVTSPIAAQPASIPPATIPPRDPWPKLKKLLVIADVTTGWHHDSINHAMAVIERLGRDSGRWATVIRTDSQLLTKKPIPGQGTRYTGRPINAHNLDFFDGIFFLGSGAGTLTPEQKADLLGFVHDDGKGFVAGHAASVAYYDWPQYGDMIGAFMKSEYRPGPFTVLNADAKFPGANAFPSTFKLDDQFAVMRPPFSSKDVHVVLRLDPRTMAAEQLKERPDGDFPLVWAKSYGKGRVYNITLAHDEMTWDDPRFQKMALEGISWALGIEPADDRPGNSQPPAPAK